MDLLLDTCALIWLLDDPSCLSDRVRDQVLDMSNNVFVSAISVLEIQIKKAKKQLETPDDLLKVIEDSGFEFLPINEKHAFKSASLFEHHKDPFDRLLIAQAMLEKMVIVTSDTNFEQYGVAVLKIKKPNK